MGVFQINKIKTDIKKVYNDLINLDDYNNRSEEDKKNAFLTRALNAFAVQKLCNGEPEKIARSICDGYDDNGIDCIYYNEDEITLYLTQSKWSNDGNSSPALGDIDKFISGVRDLISCRFSNFNEKVQNREEEIEDILYNTKKLKINLVLVHTSTQTSTHVLNRFEEFLLELNDTSDSFSFINIDQKKLFEYIEGETIRKINIDEVVLNQWGKIIEPKKAYYGNIDGSEIAKWFEEHGRDLFSKNIRMILPDSEINTEIKETILNEPENFWYYNNGITLIGKNIIKRAINGDKRDFAVFDCEDISIINGAQTVGTIGKYALEYKNDEEKMSALDKVKVQIRLIDSHEDTRTNDFTDDVTKANNRQNKVENRDFISLEVNQKRIASELRVVDITYNILRSDNAVKNETSFDLIESTRALSNILDITSSTLVHREPSKVWSDVKHKRYKQLFNAGVKGAYVWNSVRIQRIIDENLTTKKMALKGDKKSLLTYGEDVISCIVFNKIKSSIQNEIIMELEKINSFNIEEIINYSIVVLNNEIKRIGKGIPTIFKNFTHCNEIYLEAIGSDEYINISKFKES
ncbi:AIPR family protein [Clostridium perfringens]|uniref:AIPR family protein n=1 Tax=Clostridium perfringens TaxID=1502 RepID=UPI001304A70A|nr:AIPR family protein [Clostridium perfringens]